LPLHLAPLSPPPYSSPFFFLLIPRPPPSPLFPYTTLFRSGQSAGHSLWLGRHRRLWLGLVRNWSFWCSRGRLGLTAVQPRKIIGTAGRGGYCLAIRQNFRRNRVADGRAAAGNPKQVVRVFVLVLPRPSQRDHGPHQRPLGRF